jgi:CzcA family heavy metal efflux pump
MRWIVTAALRFRVLVIGLAVLLIGLAPRALDNAPLDVFPEFAPPLVEVQTEAPGLATDEVERLVTIPIENAVIGTAWVETVRSKSVLGLSSVVLIFREGTDLLDARQLVQERVGRVQSELPALANPPVLLSPLSSLSRVLKIGLSSKQLSQIELTTLAKWTIRPRLMAIEGVANVAIWGQRDHQLQVLVDPTRLTVAGLTLEQVIRATTEASAVGAGGFIDTPNQRLAVQQRSGIRGVEDLAGAVVAVRNGTTVTLGDVTRVVEGHPAPIGDAVINDGPGLLLIVEKQPWGNTLEVTRAVEEALEALRPALAGVEVDPTIFRPATFIEQSLRNLNRSLLLGIVLVVLVLAIFLADWRTALISVLAIPLSLLSAVLVLRNRGETIDTMILAGLVIALGEVVDDAIIDIENIARRLRLNRELGHAARPALAVVLDASLEVRSSVVYGSLIVVLVFLPIFFLEGLSGAFFGPLALTYVLAIGASLVVALSVTPALALILLGGRTVVRPEGRAVGILKQWYRDRLPKMIERPRRALVAAAVALVVTAISFPLLGEEFLPHFREYDFLMHWVEKPGTSLEAMQRITVQASRELRAIPGVRNFGAHLGRAEVADEVVGPNFTELWISLDPEVDYQPTVAKVQAVVDGYPGLYRDLLTYLRERVKEVLTGASATVVVRIAGPDLTTLLDRATTVRDSLSGIPGVIDLKVQQQVLVPQVEVRIRPEAGRQFGVTSGQVQRSVSTLVRGAKVGEFYQDQQIFDVAVWSDGSVRSDPGALRSILIDTPLGGPVPLGALAAVELRPAPNEITREGGSRRIDVTLNVAGRSLGAVAGDIATKLAGVTFDRGYHAEILGEYAEREASSQRLVTLGILALLGVFLLLYTDFGTVRLASLVMATLPFALIGGVAATWLSGGLLSLGSLIGFITVLGIAARNGIMLVSHYRHLEREEGMTLGPALVLQGSEERLAPILMTALVTALALLPIALGGSRAGQEIEHPMAVVILGGLVSSTILNLGVMPALYLRFGKSDRS